MYRKLNKSFDTRLWLMEHGVNDKLEKMTQQFQMMIEHYKQNQNRFGQNKNHGRKIQKSNKKLGQGKNWQNRQNKGNGLKELDVQCTYCKRWRHTVADCTLFRDELGRRGFKIMQGNGSGNNYGNFKPGQGKGNRDKINNSNNNSQIQGNGRPNQLNCVNDGMNGKNLLMNQTNTNELQTPGYGVEYEPELNN